MSRCFKHNIFGPGFCPIRFKLCGISAQSLGKAGFQSNYRIGGLYRFGFNMVCIILADALCGALVTALDLFPFIGGRRPIMSRCFKHNIFCLGLCPVKHEAYAVSAQAVLKAGRRSDNRVGSF